jgi:hypothetical protein
MIIIFSNSVTAAACYVILFGVASFHFGKSFVNKATFDKVVILCCRMNAALYCGMPVG